MALEPRIASAFDAYERSLRRVIAIRIALVVLALLGALYVRHWAGWVAFGMSAFFIGLPVGMLTYVGRAQRRTRAKLEDDPARITWVHTAKEPRTKLHRLEVHDRGGEIAYLFVPEPDARAAAEAARDLPHRPVVTTSDEERKAHEASQREPAKVDA